VSARNQGNAKLYWRAEAPIVRALLTASLEPSPRAASAQRALPLAPARLDELALELCHTLLGSLRVPAADSANPASASVARVQSALVSTVMRSFFLLLADARGLLPAAWDSLHRIYEAARLERRAERGDAPLPARLVQLLKRVPWGDGPTLLELETFSVPSDQEPGDVRRARRFEDMEVAAGANTSPHRKSLHATRVDRARGQAGPAPVASRRIGACCQRRAAGAEGV
jgi:hypothetical protein